MNSIFTSNRIVRVLFVLLTLSGALVSNQSNAQCLGTESVTFSPMPTGGAYAPGTVVTICYNLSSYTLATSSWLDGFAVTLGSGWTNPQPLLAPVSCSGDGGTWIWQTSLTAGGSGLSFGNGFYYDRDNNGDGGDDWGDNGTCAQTFCITAVVVTNSNLSIGVTVGGDGSMGSYAGTDCPLVEFVASPLSDNDFDGYLAANDCNDNDPTINPGATEVCDGIDQDCNGISDNGFDMDGDGVTTCAGDCNDNDAAIFPGAVCNDGNPSTGGDVIQADCSCLGFVTPVGEEPYLPFVADQLTGCISVTVDPSLYTPTTLVAPPGCGANTATNPKPDVWFMINVPASGTLYLNPQDATSTVDAAMAAYTYDPATNTYTLVGCNDDGLVAPSLYMPVLTVTQPAGTPIYVQLWAYAGGLITFDFCSADCTTPTAYFADTDGDGFGNPSAVVYACATGPGVTADNTDCNDTCPSCFVGGAETCDALDNDCDGVIDDNCVTVDADGDGFNSLVDCDDANPSINPNATEICDYLDNNCDGQIDEFAQTNFYADNDGDGFGDINVVVYDCTAPFGYVADFSDCDDAMITYQDLDGDGFGGNAYDPCGVMQNSDCNDNAASAYPGGTEVCGDLIDNNCDGTTDEGCGTSDADGDGFDVTVDCNDNCATIYPGAPCDDNNASTTGETIQADCSCGGGTTITNCLGSESIVFTPAPTAGTWPVGTTVEVCYTLNYAQASGDWLDGMAVTLGTGWGTPTGTIAPANCGGGAPLWIWQTSNTPTATSGVPSGYGWYYDTNGDGNGGNDWGDAGSCTFNMCFSATTVAATDLWVAVASGGDSYYGSYSSTAGCPLIPYTVDPVNVPSGCQLSFPYCATPSACDPITNIYSLTAVNSNLIQMSNAPTTGTLDVTLDGVLAQSFTAPFASSAALNITNLDSDGAVHTLVATFSDSPGCSATITYTAPASCSDGDGDGFGFTADCNDADPNIYPGAPEVCGNSIDDNCDNVVDEGCGTDVDGDGFDTTVDCNDNDATVNPGATETCGDAIDNNCSGCVDEGCGSAGDEPCNAFTADPLTGCISISVDPSLYTPSNPPGAAGCAGNYTANPRPDVWVLLNAPASGTLFLNPQGTVDAGMAAYTYDPVTLTYTQLGCDDDTGPGLMPQLTLSVTPGTPVYIQLWAYGGGLIDFSFCSSDCTTPTAYYVDADGDGYGNSNAIYTCTPDPTWIATGGDCDDANNAINPASLETCGDGLDNNCDGEVDEGCTVDTDGDGTVDALDCAPTNPSIYPGATEVCNTIDEDCDGVADNGLPTTDYFVDVDADGYGGTISVPLCYDPANPPVCNYTFNLIDTYGDGWNNGYIDLTDNTTGAIVQSIGVNFTTGTAATETAVLLNGSTYNFVWTSGGFFATEIGMDVLDPAFTTVYSLPANSSSLVGTTLYTMTVACPAETGYVTVGGDCNDFDATANPGAIENCTDLVDNNCNGQIDEALDADGDGISECAGDCDDTNPAIFPGATEVCNNADDNCDGQLDEFVLLTFYADLDGDGFGNINDVQFACTAPAGYVADNTDCDDAMITYADLDGDGFGSSTMDACGILDNTDCNDADATANPISSEVCGDGVDNNCDGQIDEGCGIPGCMNMVACNFNPAATIDDGSCQLPAPEVCDGIDNDCDGIVDDGVLNTFYADVDGDGLGNANNSLDLCIVIPGFVTNSNDCDDSDATLLGPGSACDNGSTLDTLDTFQADCSCQGLLFGCTDLVACNYDANATYEDGSCTYSSLQLASITGDTLVLPFTQAHQYSYPDTIPGLSFQWSLNPLGVFIPNSSIDTTSVITVFWSNATSTIPDGVITLVVTDENCGPNASFTLTYIVHFDTTDYSVDEMAINGLHVWPNPSNGNLNIEVPKDLRSSYQVVVTDMVGQIVHAEQSQNEVIWNRQLSLSAGMYVLRMVGENKSYSVPIVIEK